MWIIYFISQHTMYLVCSGCCYLLHWNIVNDVSSVSSRDWENSLGRGPFLIQLVLIFIQHIILHIVGW